MQDLKQLQAKIQYYFKDESLLLNALAHSSYVNEKKGEKESNERLEFLGDSVLGFITAEFFYKHFRHLPEGDLTKLRAATVCEKALCSFASEINLGEFLELGKGEIASGGRERPSMPLYTLTAA